MRPREGLEFDWLATDERGVVALFSAAGGGYVPRQVSSVAEARDAAVAALLEAPRTTSASFAEAVAPGLENPWEGAAARGVFVYDSDFFGGLYRLVAAPLVPRVPDPLAASAILLRLTGVRLGDDAVLDAQALEAACCV